MVGSSSLTSIAVKYFSHFFIVSEFNVLTAGTTVKPIFVYAPAINEKNINPFTKILDESIDFNRYSPENYDKKFHGWVTVTESLKNSYNVPAVKTLNSLTIKKCEKYLTAMSKLNDLSFFAVPFFVVSISISLTSEQVPSENTLLEIVSFLYKTLPKM